EGSVANTDANRGKALAYLKNLKGSGGTEMMKAIQACLGGPQDDKRLRVVCFMTDGYVGNDHTIIDEVKKNAADTRVFSFGIGSSVNRYLLDGMAGAGRGEVHYVLNAKQAEGAAERFYERISAPVLTDIELDFGELAVEQVYPRAVPDLFSAKPVVVKGRYRAGGRGVITLRGRNAKGAFSRQIEVILPEVEPANAVLAQQWARAKVDFLMGQDLRGVQQGSFKKELKDEVIGLGVGYQLLTAFTSFVAVEELRITQGGQARTVRVPVEMPQGVSYEGVFGSARKQSFSRRALMTKSASRPHPVSPQSLSLGGAAQEGSPADRTHWALPGLEKQHEQGKLSPKEIEEQLLPLKLDKKLLELLKKGGSDPVEVQVQVRDLSEKTLAALKALGFTELGRTRSVKLLIGTIATDKLKALALLKSVRRITPLN
ncbi:MAG: hypothetical protein OER86_13425, partial [Phycisphaerae bacterium]|nr:hypothetical protein [Phycisphaerae bacterium]